jgi:mannose-6-phosphate isomerase-like protein (cupin superfamily)
MVRWTLVLPLFAACAANPTHGTALTPQEFQTAVERGRALERSAPELEAQPSGGSYRWMRVTESRGPRVHEATDLSILVLSGRVRVLVPDREQELVAGDSILVRHGTPYVLETDREHGSSVLLLFAGDEAERGRVSMSDARTP